MRHLDSALLFGVVVESSGSDSELSRFTWVNRFRNEKDVATCCVLGPLEEIYAFKS
jgi:hypothetical protein